MAERALFAVREASVRSGDEEIRVSLSIGVAHIQHGESAEAWMKRADRALYASKEAGRDRATYASKDPA